MSSSYALRVLRHRGVDTGARSRDLLTLADAVRRSCGLQEALVAFGAGGVGVRMNAGPAFDTVLSRARASLRAPNAKEPTHALKIASDLGGSLAPSGTIEWSELSGQTYGFGFELQLALDQPFEQAYEVLRACFSAVAADRAWVDSSTKRAFASKSRFGIWTLVRQEERPPGVIVTQVPEGFVIKALDGDVHAQVDSHENAVVALHRAPLAAPKVELRSQGTVPTLTPNPTPLPGHDQDPASSALDRPGPNLDSGEKATLGGVAERSSPRQPYLAVATEELPPSEELERLIRDADPRTAMARAGAHPAITPQPKQRVPPTAGVASVDETLMLLSPFVSAAAPTGTFRDALAPLVVPTLSIADYARFRAALRFHGEDHAATFRLFGVACLEVRDRLQSQFASRFQKDAAGQAEFLMLFERYLRALNGSKP